MRRKGVRSRRTFRKRVKRTVGKRRFRPKRRNVTSKRRIVSVTSKKKHDTLLPTVITDPTVSANATILSSADPTYCVQNYTYRNFGPLYPATVISVQQAASLANSAAARTSQRVWLKGISERYRINIISSGAWFHRRIVFQTHERYTQGDLHYDQAAQGLGYSIPIDTYSIPAGTSSDDLIEQVFAGSKTRDWNDPISARVDTSRVRVLKDRTRTYNPAVDTGKCIGFKIWTPLNKSFVYDDDEQGMGMVEALDSLTYGQGSAYSNKHHGHGNVYVLDIFEPGSPGDGNLTFHKEATFYWHER